MKAREFACEALYAIMVEKSYSNLYLRKYLNKVDENEKSLATQLVYGTLQNASYVRSIWEEFVDKRPPIQLCILLDISVYQLEFLSMPNYAVLQEMVNLTKKIDGNHSKFVNAVLRNVTRRVKKEYTYSLSDIALTTSHPLWLVQMWAKQYGEDTAIQICRENNQEKPLSVRLDLRKFSKGDLLDTGNYIKGKLSPVCFHYIGNHLFSEKEFLDGSVIVQDEASQMVALALEVEEGMRVFDACSAPGTKTSQIAQLMNDIGTIEAYELHPHRVELVKELLDKLDLHCVSLTCGDGRTTTLKEESFDRVLCDVPCTGYGVLARKSDIKYHMQSEDMDTLIPVQYAILKEGIRLLKHGGYLVYSTCTLNKKENEKQIEKVLKEYPNLSLMNERTIFPFTYHSDGFYIAVLTKKE